MFVTIKKIDNGFLVTRGWTSGLAQREEYTHDGRDAIVLATEMLGQLEAHVRAYEEAASIRARS